MQRRRDEVADSLPQMLAFGKDFERKDIGFHYPAVEMIHKSC